MYKYVRAPCPPARTRLSSAEQALCETAPSALQQTVLPELTQSAGHRTCSVPAPRPRKRQQHSPGSARNASTSCGKKCSYFSEMHSG